MTNCREQLVSIVVTTRNEEENIVSCLTSIFNQSVNSFEVILIDNFSNDNTIRLAKQFDIQIYQAGPERCRQRNLGICNFARGKFAMYIDADMILGPKVVEECLRIANQHQIQAIYIEEVVVGRSVLSKVRRFERTFYSGTPVDAVRFFVREEFCRIGGFDETLQAGGEDWDLDRRLSRVCTTALLGRGEPMDKNLYPYQVLSSVPTQLATDAVIFHNDQISSMITYLSKKSQYSNGVDQYVEKWGRNDPIVKKQVGLVYRLAGVFFESRKWRKSVRMPHLLLASIGLKLLVGASYLVSRICLTTSDRSDSTEHGQGTK